jgi:hypothetical protein
MEAMNWLKTQAKGLVEYAPEDWDDEHRAWAIVWRSEDLTLLKLFNPP